MEREELFHPGDIVRHFKRDLFTAKELAAEPNKYLYEIVGIAEETEAGKPLMIYRALYGDHTMFARPLAMFLSAVDKKKYPNTIQTYRYELVDLSQIH